MSRPSNMPYIKSEQDDFDTLNSGHYNFNSPQNFGSFPQYSNGGIDPSELSMGGGNFNQQFNFGGQNMSSSFMGGSAAFGEDELLESLSPQDFGKMPHNGSHGMSIDHGQMNNIYSSTPDGAPIQSPFTTGFDYSQFRPMNSIPQHMSPHQGMSYMNKRPSMPAQRKSSTEKRGSYAMTPRTSAMANLHIGTPESAGLQQNGRPIRAPSSGSRHQKTLSGHFDSTPGSVHSYLDSPLASPSNLSHPPG